MTTEQKYLFDCYDTRWGCVRTAKVNHQDLVSRRDVQYFKIVTNNSCVDLPYDAQLFTKKPDAACTKLKFVYKLEKGTYVLLAGGSRISDPSFRYEKIRQIEMTFVDTSDILLLDSTDLGYTYSQLKPEIFQPVINYTQRK